MNIINKSFFFFLITIFTLFFSVKSQSNAENTPANKGKKFPDNTLQKTVKTRTPEPQGPEIPERPQRPQSPESPEGSEGDTGDTGLIGPQGPID